MKINELYKYLPNDKIDWELIFSELLLPYKDSLENTAQDPSYHNEGNVLIHTKIVCERLIKLPEYLSLPKDEKLVLFFSALFHDIAKPISTKIIDGRIASPNHGPKGASITREYLYKKFDIAGSKEHIEFREGICLLIKYHTSPLHIPTEDNGTKKLIMISLNHNLTKYFSIKNLCILAKADVYGRISNDTNNQIEKIDFTINLAIDLNCYDKAFKFNNSVTKGKYFSTDTVWYNDSLYDDTYGEVYVMSGLPGVGKDTYIKNNIKNLPVVSLDDIRDELKISPLDDQGLVINEAINRAKKHLRNKQQFIWNATNTTAMMRKKIIQIINDYHARVCLIYLETSYSTNINRNQSRKKEVPAKVIDKLLSHMNIPEDYEAHVVKWITT